MSAFQIQGTLEGWLKEAPAPFQCFQRSRQGAGGSRQPRERWRETTENTIKAGGRLQPRASSPGQSQARAGAPHGCTQLAHTTAAASPKMALMLLSRDWGLEDVLAPSLPSLSLTPGCCELRLTYSSPPHLSLPRYPYPIWHQPLGPHSAQASSWLWGHC